MSLSAIPGEDSARCCFTFTDLDTKLCVKSREETMSLASAQECYKRYTCKSRGIVGMLPAMLYPVRTNTWTNLAKDFFLPTLVNQALRVKSVALRRIAVIVAGIFDLITLPIRIVTVIPRCRSNANKELHPILQDFNLKNVCHVIVKLEAWRETETSDYWGFREDPVRLVEVPHSDADDYPSQMELSITESL